MELQTFYHIFIQRKKVMIFLNVKLANLIVTIMCWATAGPDFAIASINNSIY